MQQQALAGKKYWLFCLLILFFLAVFAYFAARTFQVALLEGHCVKTSNNITIAANVVKYREYRVFYADYYVSLDNPRGRTASWTRHETPLNIYLLAWLFWLTGSDSRDAQILIARSYTWLHYLLAYWLIVAFLFRGNHFKIFLFTLFYLLSSFTVYYSTRPFAENYAVLYQALLLITLTHLMRQERSAYSKAGIIVLVSALFCLAGKMNYFLIAGPVAVVFPFCDPYLSQRRLKLQYFSVLGLTLVAVTLLLLGIGYNLKQTLIFFIIGNRGLYHGSYWLTFWEGFLWFPKIFLRTWDDFGFLVFWGGLAGILLLFVRIAAKSFSRQQPPPIDCEHRAILILTLGHVINYIVLRNLYIPHNYYLIPTYMIFVLALVSLVSSVHNTIAASRLSVPERWRIQPLFHYFRIDNRRANYIEKALKPAIVVTVICASALLLPGMLVRAFPYPMASAPIAGIVIVTGMIFLLLAVIFVLLRLLNDIFWRRASGIATRVNQGRAWQLLWLTLIAALFLWSGRGHYARLKEYYSLGGSFRKILADVKKFQELTPRDATILCNNCCLGCYLDRKYILPYNYELKNIDRYRNANIRYYVGTLGFDPPEELLPYMRSLSISAEPYLVVYEFTAATGSQVSEKQSKQHE